MPRFLTGRCLDHFLGAIPLPQLLDLQMLKRCAGSFRLVKCLGAHLTALSDPTPVSDQRDLTEERGFEGQCIEPRHVSARVQSGHIKWRGHRVHHMRQYRYFDYPGLIQFLNLWSELDSAS